MCQVGDSLEYFLKYEVLPLNDKRLGTEGGTGDVPWGRREEKRHTLGSRRGDEAVEGGRRRMGAEVCSCVPSLLAWPAYFSPVSCYVAI